ncbi:hypothetical protein KP509_03G056700 [Ceratopteris richardii]|uniref:Uncharacterized protein n=1 Tax=Ceratopteris richardii TaxID=49495 RepID=A0A8T2V3Q8_CERRI|nr:hypothetical protein KP509_03G056700 [Ceratopteris richardii]
MYYTHNPASVQLLSLSLALALSLSLSQTHTPSHLHRRTFYIMLFSL